MGGVAFVFAKGEPQQFEQHWSAYVGGVAAPWSYPLLFLKYMRFYSGSRLVEDLSFVCVENGKCAGVAHLFLEKGGDGELQFSYAGDCLRAPLCKNPDIEKGIFAKIDELAAEKGVAKAMMMVEPAAWLSAKEKYNFLQKYGYLDASICSSMVNLAPSEDALRKAMRHGHESLIKSREKDFEAVVVDHANPDFAIHEEYRMMHRKASGRVTRAIETFQLQFDIIKKDEGALIGLKHKGKFVSFAYFYHHGKASYYGSAADDPDFKDVNGLYHVMTWEAIKYYKRRGFDWVELGWQQFGLQVFDNPSEKDVKISHFKRGFGVTNVPLHRGIKYYRYETLEKDINGFLAAAKEKQKKEA